MKSLCAILLVLVAAQALDLSKFTALVQTGTRANDAVESVYNLLRDLKTENLNVQVAADKKNATDEEIGARIITELTQVANINKGNFDNAKAATANVETQIRDTNSWLAWAEGRLAEIAHCIEGLTQMRCFANALFVKSLADHQDALEVIRLLRQDIAGTITNNAGSLAQVGTQNIADKLSSYSHLFQQDAIKKFLQLTVKDNEGEQETRANGDSIGEQVFNLLIDLEAELNTTLAHIQEEEIAAAYALAKWVGDVQAERAYISNEIERKTAFLEKLNTQLPASLSIQAKANAVWKESILALEASSADLEEKREFYHTETERRNEENAIIDMCIQIFKDQVRDLVSGTSLKRL